MRCELSSIFFSSKLPSFSRVRYDTADYPEHHVTQRSANIAFFREIPRFPGNSCPLWVHRSDVVDRAEDCNYSGICGKPVVTPEIGLSPGSETLYRTNPEVQRPLSEGEGGYRHIVGCMDGEISLPAFPSETQAFRISPLVLFPAHSSWGLRLWSFSARSQARPPLLILIERFA